MSTTDISKESATRTSHYLQAGFIRNCWYVAAWSHEVGPDNLFPRTLLGEPILLYRAASGDVIALKDQCCHRAAPLSAGRREGDCVRCMYHGMKFDANGRCIEIPGQDHISNNARVRKYPTVERNRFIWIWMGAPQDADPSGILDFFWHDSADWRMKPGYIHYRAHYQLVADNLLDFSHLSFVHPTTLGTSASAQTRPQVDRIDGGLRITRWDINSDLAPNQRRVASFSGKVDRWQIYEWHAPSFMRMDAGAQPTGTGAPQGQRSESAIRFRHTSVQTPETANTTHYFFCQARAFNLDDEAMTEAIFSDVSKAFAEDRAIIEAQQRNLDLDPMFKPVATQHDLALNQARFLVRQRLEQEGGL